jgi:hypothetical protein
MAEKSSRATVSSAVAGVVSSAGYPYSNLTRPASLIAYFSAPFLLLSSAVAVKQIHLLVTIMSLKARGSLNKRLSLSSITSMLVSLRLKSKPT